MEEAYSEPCKALLIAETLVLSREFLSTQCFYPEWVLKTSSMLPIAMCPLQCDHCSLPIAVHPLQSLCLPTNSDCDCSSLITMVVLTCNIVHSACLAGCCWLFFAPSPMYCYVHMHSTPCPPQPVCTCALHSPSSYALTWHWQLHSPSDAAAPASRTQESASQWTLAAWLTGVLDARFP